MWLAETNCALSKRPHAPVSHHLWQLNPFDPKPPRLSVWPEHRAVLYGQWVSHVCHTVFFFLVDVVVVVCRQVTQGPIRRKKIPFTWIRSTENDVVPVPALVGRRKFRVVSVWLKMEMMWMVEDAENIALTSVDRVKITRKTKHWNYCNYW